MLFTVDIDQFLIVKYIIRGIGSRIASKITFYNNFTRNYNYLPREFFNMIQIKEINFDFVSEYIGFHHLTRVTNHDQCKWANFVNLSNIYNYDIRKFNIFKN